MRPDLSGLSAWRDLRVRDDRSVRDDPLMPGAQTDLLALSDQSVRGFQNGPGVQTDFSVRTDLRVQPDRLV